MRRRRPTAHVLALSLLTLAACGETPVDHNQPCVPGSTQLCVCPPPGAQGAQICLSTGLGWGPCNCGLQPGTDGQAPWPDGGTTPPPRPDSGAAGDGSEPPKPDASPAPKPAGAQPVMIAAGHYVTYRAQLLGLRPLIVYAWAADPALSMYSKELSTLGSIKDTQVTKMVMFSSFKTLSAKLGATGHVAQLKQLGVTGLGYNTEGDKTPASEMQNLAGAVSQFAALAQKHGLQALWGPIRATVDQISDTALTQMINAGLDGVGLQEQKWIEAACPQQRVTAVKATSARLKKLAGGKPFDVQVQIMPSRCINGDAYGKQHCGGSGKTFAHCVTFSDQIKPAVDSMAIWASGPQDNSQLVPLIKALRHAP